MATLVHCCGIFEIESNLWSVMGIVMLVGAGESVLCGEELGFRKAFAIRVSEIDVCS